MNRATVVESLQTNYLDIKEGKGKWLDKRVIYLIARSFAVNNRRYIDEDYKKIEQTIKSEIGFFTVLGQPVKGILIGLLLSNGKNSQAIHTLFADYERLRAAGFQLSSYSYFASYLLQYTEAAEKELVIRKAKDIYDQLKKQHYFLTGPEDGALAISLTQQKQLEKFGPEIIGSVVEEYYQRLNETGFSKSNQLQFAAATAAMLTGQFDEELIERTTQMIDRLKQMKIRFKSEHYTNIVALAFLDSLDPINLDVLAVYLELLEEKTNLRFYKEFRQSLALGLVINEKMVSLSMENINLTALTLTMTIMNEINTIVAMTAITAAASSANS
ncbi:DUF4003 family protein [Enterococcus sp. LJL99]